MSGRTMTRDELIEAMARAVWSVQGYCYDTDERLFEPMEYGDEGEYAPAQRMCQDAAERSLSALCAAIPGLSDVIDGKAVIVPRDCTGEMLEAGKKAWRRPRLHVSHQLSDDLNTCGVIYTAMIEARPK